MTPDVLTQIRQAVLERGTYLRFEDFCERLNLQPGSEAAATTWGQWQRFVEGWKPWLPVDLARLLEQREWSAADILRNEA